MVLFVGVKGSGKSAFAKQHFKKEEVIPFEEELNEEKVKALRGQQSPALQEALLQVEDRLKNKQTTAVDGTNLNARSRKAFRMLANKHHAVILVLLFDLPTSDNVSERQAFLQKKTLKSISNEGFKRITIFHSKEELPSVTITRKPMPSDFKHEKGPFDLIGDVHGCFDELKELLVKLNYKIIPSENPELYGYEVSHPSGRRLIFVGDFTDRGPKSPEVLRLVMSMWKSGIAFCAPGNHDDKLRRKLSGKNVKLTHGLDGTMEQLEKEPPEFHEEIRKFIRALPSHLELDDGKLVAAHAGLKESYHGRHSGKVFAFCLYGDVTGKLTPEGKPERLVWAKHYTGSALIVYGHTPVPEPDWINNTVDIDTGCVFGGKLTALCYPERTLVEVSAHKTYCEYGGPILPLIK